MINLIKLNPISKLPLYLLVRIANNISQEENVALMLDQHIEQRKPADLPIEEDEFGVVQEGY